LIEGLGKIPERDPKGNGAVEPPQDKDRLAVEEIESPDVPMVCK